MKKTERGDLDISMDIIVEILKKLPSKSLVRFRSVSKQWRTIIGSCRYFIEFIITRSLAHPPQKLPLFIFHHCVTETFFTVSSVFSQNTKPTISLVPGSSCYFSFEYQYVRGLICCYSPKYHLVTIYNPTTRQSFSLPEMKSSPINTKSYCYFGYDHILNQYKVLKIIVDYKEWKQTYHIFTLERNQFWRKIKGIDDNEKLFPIVNRPVCIDGTIYFGVKRLTEKHKFGETLLMSFSISSERFDHVWVPQTLLRAMLTFKLDHQTLVNYQGKLGCICCTREDTSIWIMDNAEKQEWSRIIFWLPMFPLMYLGFDVNSFSGATPGGEIFATSWAYYFSKSLYVYYYDMKQNSFRRIKVQGTTTGKIEYPDYNVRVYPIHDHVENTMWF